MSTKNLFASVILAMSAVFCSSYIVWAEPVQNEPTMFLGQSMCPPMYRVVPNHTTVCPVYPGYNPASPYGSGTYNPNGAQTQSSYPSEADSIHQGTDTSQQNTAATDPYTSANRRETGNMSNSEYDRFRTDSQRTYSGANNFGSRNQNAIGMETFGDALGASAIGVGNLIAMGDNAYGLMSSSLGRVKMVENMSPIPQDRFIFDYNYFRGVSLTESKRSVHRFLPGFEKTFFNGSSSIEMRFPMGVTASRNRYADYSTDTQATEFGDIAIYFKSLFYRTQSVAWSCGLGVSLPTAAGIKLYDDPQTRTLLIEMQNKTVRVMPFVGMMWTPNRAWFVQAIAQWDVDTTGNPVYFRDGLTNQMIRAGTRSRDMTYQYLSASVGRWIYKDDCKRYGLTAMNLMGEMHWSRSLDFGQDVTGYTGGGLPIDTIGNFGVGANMLNFTMGTRMVFNRRHNVGTAFCLPITSGADGKAFDGELRMTYNIYF